MREELEKVVAEYREILADCEVTRGIMVAKIKEAEQNYLDGLEMLTKTMERVTVALEKTNAILARDDLDDWWRGNDEGE
jgi:hypothetical protein